MSCSSFLVVSLEFSVYNIIPSANSGSFNTSFPIWFAFLYFSSLTAVARTSKTMLINNGKNEYSSLTTIIQHSFGSPSYGNQRRKINKRNPDLKRRSKTLTADDMILYVENQKDTIRKLIELINEFSKVTGHKIKT